MNFIKKYWYLLAVATITLGLGVVTFLTSQKLQNTGPIAPNVPQDTPKASTKACTFTFSLPSSPSLSPTQTPTKTIAPTPTPNSQCGAACTTNAQCPLEHACSSGKCRLEVCLRQGILCDSSKCAVLPTSSPTETKAPTPTRTPTSTRTPTPIPPSSCDNGCTVSSDCQTGLICSGGSCRNPQCTEKDNCVCDVPTETPEPTISDVTPTEVPVPEVPVSGSGPTSVGMLIVGVGMALLLMGFAF